MSEETTVTVYIDNDSYQKESTRANREAFLRKHIHPDADETSLSWEERNSGGWKGTLTYKRRTNLDILGLLRKYAEHDKLKLEAALEIERLRAKLELYKSLYEQELSEKVEDDE